MDSGLYEAVSPDDKYRTGLHLSNSMNGGRKHEFIPELGKKVTWYSCGPTVYDAAHLGHARNYVTFDIIRRCMEDYFGYDVHQVMNVTDIDDKIIIRSKENGEHFAELARRWEFKFWDDMKAMGCKAPDVVTRVTEYVPEIVSFIERIILNGFAYESNGSVYFDIDAFQLDPRHNYSRMDPSRAVDTVAILEGEGALAQGTDKRSPRDFALWKKAKTGEPSWPSPWSEGRPGWHIECSAMACEILGDRVDIHSGGVDLCFPHHTNELAQSEAWSNRPQWVNYFLHAGHLHIDGLKMSKSLKNFLTIEEVLKDAPMRVWRYFFMTTSGWNAPMTYDPKGCGVVESRNIDKAFSNFFKTVKVYLRDSGAIAMNRELKLDGDAKEFREDIAEAERQVHERLCDDLDFNGGIQALRMLVGKVNKYIAKNQEPSLLLLRRASEFVYRTLSTFGCVTGTVESLDYEGREEEDGIGSGRFSSVLDTWVAFRDDIRNDVIKVMRAKEVLAAKEAAKAVLAHCDKIRDEGMLKLGVQIEDAPGGSIWKEC